MNHTHKTYGDCALTGNSVNGKVEVQLHTGKRIYVNPGDVREVSEIDEGMEVATVSAIERLAELEDDIRRVYGHSKPPMDIIKLQRELLNEAAAEIRVKWFGHD